MNVKNDKPTRFKRSGTFLFGERFVIICCFLHGVSFIIMSIPQNLPWEILHMSV